MIEISKENQKRDQKMSINKFQEIEQDIGERSWVGEGPKIGKYTQKFWFEKKKKNRRKFERMCIIIALFSL